MTIIHLTVYSLDEAEELLAFAKKQKMYDGSIRSMKETVDRHKKDIKTRQALADEKGLWVLQET